MDYKGNVLTCGKTRKKCRKLAELMGIDVSKLDKIIERIGATIYGPDAKDAIAFFQEHMKSFQLREVTTHQAIQWELTVGSPGRNAREHLFGAAEAAADEWSETREKREKKESLMQQMTNQLIGNI